MTWIVSALALTGVVLNIYKSKYGFVVWVFTNAFWAIYDYHIGATAQAALFFVYFLLALWGLWKWRGDGHGD